MTVRTERLTRSQLPGLTPAPIRIVHIGIGAFHRAHQAWYTARATDSDQWGIAAYTVRSPDAAAALVPQDGLYTLIERDIEDDRLTVIPSIVKVRDGADLEDFTATVADPAVAVITLTITEAGYHAEQPDTVPSPAVEEDVRAVREWTQREESALPAPTTPLVRLLLGLEVRRRAGGGPVAVVSCDNIPDNGRLVRGLLDDLARRISGPLAAWIGASVSTVSTSVDRITPRLRTADVREVHDATGLWDEAPVVTEPFSDWVLCGDFPGGRPAWETAGARFVDRIEPWEARKLWLLNGAHTYLACVGPTVGAETVAEAIARPRLRAAVEEFWREASTHLPDVETAEYRSALLARFANPRIEHRLTQIADDSVRKARLRVVPVARLERAAGRSASACAVLLAAVIHAARIGSVAASDDRIRSTDTATSLSAIDADLADDGEFVAAVHRALTRDTAPTPGVPVP